MPPHPVDRSALLDAVDEDPDFLESLVNAFLDDYPSYLSAIRTAVDQHDAHTLQQEAHGLKGAVANLRAERARRAAHRLEEMGEDGSFEEAPEAVEALEEELDRLRTALTEIVEEEQAEG